MKLLRALRSAVLVIGLIGIIAASSNITSEADQPAEVDRNNRLVSLQSNAHNRPTTASISATDIKYLELRNLNTGEVPETDNCLCRIFYK